MTKPLFGAARGARIAVNTNLSDVLVRTVFVLFVFVLVFFLLSCHCCFCNECDFFSSICNDDFERQQLITNNTDSSVDYEMYLPVRETRAYHCSTFFFFFCITRFVVLVGFCSCFFFVGLSFQYFAQKHDDQFVIQARPGVGTLKAHEVRILVSTRFFGNFFFLSKIDLHILLFLISNLNVSILLFMVLE